MKKREFIALIALAIIGCGLSVVSVSAKEVSEVILYEEALDVVGEGTTQIIASGLCGESVSYALDDKGLLTISGSGRMDDYDWHSSPFYEYRDEINSIVIEAGITYIGKDAFYESTALTEVAFPESVLEIGENAFGDCYRLTSVDFEEGLVNIGISAFGGCGRLTNVFLPETLKSIGNSAFAYSGLKNIHIPKEVEAIGEGAFCIPSLESMVIDTENQSFSYENKILYNKDKTHIVGALGTIGESFIIPDTVTSIGVSAFSGCSKLKSIIIPNTVISIGESAFAYSGLTSITIPDGVERIEPFTFAGCGNLKEVSFSEGIKSIGKRAFYFCTGLENVVLPEGVESIETAAFYNCSSMIEIKLPTSMTDIASAAFSSCAGLESIMIPNGVTSIEEQVFAGCRNLERIVLPNTLTSIEKEAFTQCNSLSEIILPESITSIGNGAFAYCSSIENITIPDGVTSLGETVFRECNALEFVTIPKSVTTIDGTIFYKIEHDVMIVGESGSYAQTFANLIKVPFKLLDGTIIQPTCTITYDANGGVLTGEATRTFTKRTSIGKHPVATRDGYILKGWYLYKTGGTKIPENMLIMSDFTVYAVWEKVASDTADKDDSDENSVNNGSQNNTTESSNSDTNDNPNSQNQVEINKVYTVGAYKYQVLNDLEVAFVGLKSNKTKKVTIDKTVTIEGKSFQVTTIAGKALRKKNITSLVIGANVKKIGAKAFENCKKLKTITIKSTQIKSIGKNACKGIPKKARVKVPKKKLSSYKKMLKNAGLNKKVKISK